MNKYIDKFLNQFKKPKDNNDIISVQIYLQKLSKNNQQVLNILTQILEKILLKQKNVKKFTKNNEQNIIHIRDWVFSVVISGENWKTPRVLTIDALNNSANKYFEKKNNKIQIIELNENHETLIADLEEYYIVQMLTPQALDNESKVMQHCIGHGGYDQNLKNKDYQYLSLRDKYNKAHATLEIRNKNIMQLQGKQNKIPEEKYLEKLIPWLFKNNYKNIPWRKLNKYYDSESNKWINFDKIKLIENIDYILIDCYKEINIIQPLTNKFIFCFDKKIIFQEHSNVVFVDKDKNLKFKRIKSSQITELLEYLENNNYKNVPYSEFFCIYNKNDKKVYKIDNLPDNCIIDVVDIHLFFQDLRSIKLPKGLIINGDVILRNNKIIDMEENITINGNCTLFNSEIKYLPNNLHIGNNLNLNYCRNLTNLPQKLYIGENLSICNTKIMTIPDDIIINNILDIRDTIIEKLPNNLKCKMIKINKEKANLIKENMDIELIEIDFNSYTKEEFLNIFENKIQL